MADVPARVLRRHIDLLAALFVIAMWNDDPLDEDGVIDKWRGFRERLGNIYANEQLATDDPGW